MKIDKENVIKGFTVCSEHGLLNGEDCHGHYEYSDNHADIIKVNDYSKQCPYNGCKTGCVKTLAKDAIAMLKEQEEKTGEWIYKHDNLWYCSRCGEIIYSETDDDLEIHHAYCSRCGAKMKQEGG